MACPDDDTYSRFLQGMLHDKDLVAVEAHLDECPACNELLTELGRAYVEVATTTRSAKKGTRSTNKGPRSAKKDEPVARFGWAAERALAPIELFSLIIHLLITGKVFWLLVLSESGLIDVASSLSPWETSPALLSLVGAYCLLCGPVGAVAAGIGAWGKLAGRNWSTRAARVHATFALPTILLSPLAIYVLTRYRQ